MGHDVLTGLLAWVEAHPVIALGLVFFVALAESVFLFGLLVPGALFMFAFGALIGAGKLPLAATFILAVAGTLAGDGASYVLGRAYRERVDALPGLARFPGLIARGEAFFMRHGGKAVVFGRLIGAVRPIVPTVAGAAGLSPLRFVVMDAIATALWAPIYILPGVVFGTSLDLAAQVATRLAVVLLGAAAILWATTVAARYALTAGRAAARYYAVRLVTWSQRHRRLGRLGARLADARQPELPALAVTAAVLFIAVALCYAVLWGWRDPHYPSRFDAVAFYVAQGLRTWFTDAPARMIAELGAPLIYLPFAAAIALVLFVLGNRRAAAHWLAAVGFSAATAIALRAWLSVPPPARYFQGVNGDPLFRAGGGQDLIVCATVYGLAGMIVSARQSATTRSYAISLTVAGVVLIALARFYLGLDWASDVIVGLTAAFAWINMVLLCYRRQRPRPIRGAPVAGVLGGFVLLAALTAWVPAAALRDAGPRPAPAPAIPIQGWPRANAESRLPERIRDIAGRASAPLNVQAAGRKAALEAALARAGWRAPPALGFDQILRGAAPTAAIDELAVLPRIHAGRRPAITRVHAADTPSGGEPARWVLRLWPTADVVAIGGARLWVGLIDGQRVDRRFHLWATAADLGIYAAAARALSSDLARAGIDFVVRERDRRPLVLLWARRGAVDAKVAPDPAGAFRR